MKKYIKIMRLDHWIKQLFILPGFACAIVLIRGAVYMKISYLSFLSVFCRLVLSHRQIM
jgi:hypothetical protein